MKRLEQELLDEETMVGVAIQQGCKQGKAKRKMCRPKLSHEKSNDRLLH